MDNGSGIYQVAAPCNEAQSDNCCDRHHLLELLMKSINTELSVLNTGHSHFWMLGKCNFCN